MQHGRAELACPIDARTDVFELRLGKRSQLDKIQKLAKLAHPVHPDDIFAAGILRGHVTHAQFEA